MSKVISKMAVDLNFLKSREGSSIQSDTSSGNNLYGRSSRHNNNIGESSMFRASQSTRVAAVTTCKYTLKTMHHNTTQYNTIKYNTLFRCPLSKVTKFRPQSRRISRRPPAGKKCGLAAGKIAASRQPGRKKMRLSRRKNCG